MDFNDIYPLLGTAKAGDDGDSTRAKTNASTAVDPAELPASKGSIFNIKGGFLGQPITVWLGLIGALILVKFLVEKGND